jgi:phytoene dehydrogenase-like protein
MTEVVVVGAGLAGLVAARRMAQAGADVLVLEENDEVGGRVRSHHEDGYTFDRGFQVLFTAYPAVQGELDLDALDLRYFSPGATIARPGSRSTFVDPLKRPGMLLTSLLNGDVSFLDKLRLLLLRRRLSGRDEEDIFGAPDTSIRQYLDDHGFSRRFVENFAEPFYGGITLDRALGSSSAVFEYTFRMLTEGDIAVPADGMGAIPQQLAESARAAGATVETGATVASVDGEGPTVETASETFSPRAVVVATDPKEAGRLTGVETPTETRGCITQHFAVARHRRLDTGDRILLNAEDEGPNTVAPMSTVAPEYAPDDRQLLSATFVGRTDAQGRSGAELFRQTDGDLAAEADDALRSWYPEHRFDALELLRTDRVEFAQFAQPPGFRDSLPDLGAPGGQVYLAGDYTRWSSIHGALYSGRNAAEVALVDLGI